MPKQKIDCIFGLTDISQSLLALTEKYTLDKISLVTLDGLLLASSARDTPDEEIARYCKEYQSSPETRIPGILFFRVEFKGSSLIGIAKTRTSRIRDPTQDLVAETKDILNWWI